MERNEFEERKEEENVLETSGDASVLTPSDARRSISRNSALRRGSQRSRRQFLSNNSPSHPISFMNPSPSSTSSSLEEDSNYSSPSFPNSRRSASIGPTSKLHPLPSLALSPDPSNEKKMEPRKSPLFDLFSPSNESSNNNNNEAPSPSKLGTSSSPMKKNSIFLNVKFPASSSSIKENGEPYKFPFEQKVICLDNKVNVSQAVLCIQKMFKFPIINTFALYNPVNQRWLMDIPLKDIEELPILDHVEYRNRREPINMGSVRDRRRSLQIGRKASSPFFQEWADSLKASIQKKEVEKRRHNQLSNMISGSELAELKSKLENLSVARMSRISESPKENRKRSNSTESALKQSSVGESPEYLLRAIAERDNQAQLAAEIGKALLEQNDELRKEVDALRDREADAMAREEKQSKLETKLMKFKSRCMFLESSISEAMALNESLMKSIEKDSSLGSIETLNRTRRKSQLQMNDELEEFKFQVVEAEEHERELRKKLEKLSLDHKIAEEKIKFLESELENAKSGSKELEELKGKLKSKSIMNERLLLSINRFQELSSIEGGEGLFLDDSLWRGMGNMIQMQGNEEVRTEQDLKLLSEAGNTIASIYDEVTSVDQSQQKFNGISEKLISLIKKNAEEVKGSPMKTLELKEGEEVVEDFDEMNELERVNSLSSIYFCLIVLSLAVQKEMEKKWKEADALRIETKEQLEEVSVKLKREELIREKLEEKLEISGRISQQNIDDNMIELDQLSRDQSIKIRKEREEFEEEFNRKWKRLEEEKDKNQLEREEELKKGFNDEKIKFMKEWDERKILEEEKSRNYEEKSNLFRIESENLKKEMESFKKELELEQNLRKESELKINQLKNWMISTVQSFENKMKQSLNESILSNLNEKSERIDRVNEKTKDLQSLLNRVTEAEQDKERKLSLEAEESNSQKERLKEIELETKSKLELLQIQLEELSRNNREQEEEHKNNIKRIEEIGENTLKSEREAFRIEMEQKENLLQEEKRRNIEENEEKNSLIEKLKLMELEVEKFNIERILMSEKMEEITKRDGEAKSTDTNVKETTKFEHLVGKSCNPNEERWIDIANDLLISHSLLKGGRSPLTYSYLELANALYDGVILCSLINIAAPGTIDERVIHSNPKDDELITDNHNLCINSAIGIGVNHLKNINSDSLYGGNIGFVLEFIAEMEEIYFLSKVSYTVHPIEILQLFAAVSTSNQENNARDANPEEILSKWLHFHLRGDSNSNATIKSFQQISQDLKNCVELARLLHKLDEHACPSPSELLGLTGDGLDSKEVIQEEEMIRRSALILQMAKRMGCSKPFIGEKELSTEKISVFLADLYHHFPSISKYTEEVIDSKQEVLDNNDATIKSPKISNEITELPPLKPEEDEGSREERVFRFWMNSRGFMIKNWGEDLKDGIVLLKVMNGIIPGIVNWTRVNTKVPLNAYQKIENCGYAVEVGTALKFSMINIGGKDIYEGNKKLTMGLIWQIVRLHTFTILSDLGKNMQKRRNSNRELKEEDIVKWANGEVERANKSSRMANFKDPTLKDGRFLLDLLDSVRPGRVNHSLIMEGKSFEEQKLNAQYAISLARGFGCSVFLLWEDIVEVKPKMILVFIGTIMSYWTKVSNRSNTSSPSITSPKI
eukprot:TRINITY_DN2208_c0_g1_i1.p1 TRINITY_DN2208_c0_g1~~TRINITY_DN2208_c0_g1_i1.p1  ORF type:complete len:1636 (-),score=603.17 TRINITY_DN2208_c0_g1_i1:715-5622(-)